MDGGDKCNNSPAQTPEGIPYCPIGFFLLMIMFLSNLIFLQRIFLSVIILHRHNQMFFAFFCFCFEKGCCAWKQEQFVFFQGFVGACMRGAI